jgi:hypothetical protein
MSSRRAVGGDLDIILVDTMGVTTDYLAYQLTQRGVRVHLFTPSSRWPPNILRRAYAYASYTPFGDEPSKSFAEMVERVDPAFIIPTTENAVYFVWDQPAHIQELSIPNVPPAIRPLLGDRALLLGKAAEWGVSTPESIPLTNLDDCLTAIEKGLPLVVKSGQSTASNGVALCNTSDEVIQAFNKFFRKDRSVTAQRFYVGPTYMAGGLFEHGEAIHFYAGEQTIMWPPLTGYSHEIRSAAEPHLSALLQATETVCKNLDWTGLAAFDFVLDENSQFRFVDFNPRLWGSAGALLTAEVDLYGGIDRLLRTGSAGPSSKSIPDVSYRVFPKYTMYPSSVSMWRRLMGLRDAPWDAPLMTLTEILYKAVFRMGFLNPKPVEEPVEQEVSGV